MIEMLVHRLKCLKSMNYQSILICIFVVNLVGLLLLTSLLFDRGWLYDKNAAGTGSQLSFFAASLFGNKGNGDAMFSVPPVPEYSSNDFVAPIQSYIHQKFLQYPKKTHNEKIVILTPIHNVARLLIRYNNLLRSLTYPRHLVSVVFGEDCSTDSTLAVAQSLVPDLRKEGFHRVEVFHFNLTGQINGHFSDVHNQFVQLTRRSHLAKSRNLLLQKGLKDEDWVLWIDSDISALPPDIIEHLLSAEQDIVVPSCLFLDGALKRVYDKNTWRETKFSLDKQERLLDRDLMLEGYGTNQRLYLTDLRGEGRVVKIDGVGGCTLLIKADLHRKGLNFPETIYDHHIETEGLAKMAKKMGFGVYGMPFLEVIH